MTWDQAMAFCPSDGSGFRLPSVSELQSIVDQTIERPPIDPDAFPQTPPSLFWTSSPQAGDSEAGPPKFAWFVAFIHGHADVDPVGTAHLVRCVQ
jgi:hypothetical protein